MIVTNSRDSCELAYQDLMEQGFVVIPGALNASQCARSLASIDTFKEKHQRLVAPNRDEHGHLYRVVNLHLALDALADAFVHARKALAVCDRFFDEPASLYTSLYYERGSEQALHRDTPYFCTRPANRYLGMWLALDDVDAENGPLRVVPHSHQLPPVDLDAIVREAFPAGAVIPKISVDGWRCYQAAVQAQSDARGLFAREIHVRAGDIIVWHPSMFHGGAPHLRKSRPRRSLVMHVTPRAVPVYQLDVFLDPGKQVPARAGWSYYRHGDRRIAHFKQVDFGHQFVMPVRRLRWSFG